MARLLAAIILFVPGALAAYGIKLMRDALFLEVSPILFNVGIQFVVGLILFLAGLAFIGGFVVHRDRKRNLVVRKKGKKNVNNS